MKFNATGTGFVGYPNLPAPVTSGGTQGFLDSTGEQWVANPLINNGKWSRARDALYFRWYRAAAYSPPGAATVFTYDSATRDAYQLFTNTTFTAPVQGWWEFRTQSGFNSTAVGQSLRQQLVATLVGTPIQVSASINMSGGAGSITAMATTLIWMSQNDTMVAQYFASATGFTGMVGSNLAWIEGAYRGTG